MRSSTVWNGSWMKPMGRKTYKPVILPEAQRDMREIIRYIAGTLAAPQAARNLLAAFRQEIGSLAEMPGRIRTVDEQPWKDAGIRRTLVKNYFIYFLIDEAERAVKVLAVIYAPREQEKQMADRGMETLS